MFQPSFQAYLDAIKQQYETVAAENKSLKQENTRLVETNNQYIRKIQHYMNMFNRQKCPPTESLSSPLTRSPKCLKRGSDWSVDGDDLCGISMREKIIMSGKITNAVVSICGRYVSFGCGYKVCVLIDGEIWSLNHSSEKMERYEEGISEKETQEYRICPMDFSSDSSFLYASDGRGAVRIWNMVEKTQEGIIKSLDAIGIKIVKNLVFIACRDKTLKIYDGVKQVMSLNSNEEFNGPIVVSSNEDMVCGVVGRNKILVVDMTSESLCLTNTNEERILAISLSPDDKTLSVGGYNRGLGLYKIHDNASCRIQDTIEQRGVILSLGSIRDYLLVGQPEGFMIWDLRERRSMRIQVNECSIIGISVCEECFTTVDNNGVLRIWNYNLRDS